MIESDRRGHPWWRVQRVVLMLAATLLTGCQSFPVLHDVREYRPGSLPFREQWRPMVPPEEAIPDDFKVQADDVLEISLRGSSDGPLVPLDVNTGLNQDLYRDNLYPRLPLHLLTRIEELRVVPRFGPEISIRLCDPGLQNCQVSLPGSTWSQVRAPFEDAGLRVRLLPQEPVRASPGDNLILVRWAQIVPTSIDAPAYTQAETHRLTVDPGGWVFLPPLSPSKVGMNRPGPTPAQRDLSGAVQGAYFRIRVWDPGFPYDQRPTLGELSRCLSAAWPVDSSTSDAARCHDYGISETFLPPANQLDRVGYVLLPDSLEWTLVDEEGHRFQLPYHYGVSVAAAAYEGYRRMNGRELLREPLCSRRAYLTVLPREGQRAFWGRMKWPDESSGMDDLMLMPGDTVFVSRVRPMWAR